MATTALDTTTTPAFNLGNMQQSTDWNVDPKTQTVAGQLNSVIASDSPLMQQARQRALEGMNSRGLSNSSMAIGAADSAMYDTALKIATPDAMTYADAGKTNTGTQNQFNLQSNQVTSQANATNWGAQQEFGRQKERDATQQTYDLAKLDKQTSAAIEVADIEAVYKNLTQGSTAATSILNKMQDSLNALTANKDITDPTKRDAMARDIKQNAMDSLNLVGAIAGDVDLSQFIKAIDL